MSAGLRVDLYRQTTYDDGWHHDVVSPTGSEWRWRLWSSSSIIAASSEGYDRQARAIANLETVTGGTFQKISTPDLPTPYGILYRTVPELIRDEQLPVAFTHFANLDQRIPVRLVES